MLKVKKLNFKISSGEKPPKFEYRLQDTVLLLFILNQGPSFFTVSRVREIGCFWGNPVKSTVDP